MIMWVSCDFFIMIKVFYLPMQQLHLFVVSDGSTGLFGSNRRQGIAGILAGIGKLERIYVAPLLRCLPTILINKINVMLCMHHRCLLIHR